MRLLLFISILFLSACGSKKPSKKIGDVAFITKMCLSADTEDNFKLMSDISVRKDEPALTKMIDAGSVVVIPGSTRGTIRDNGFGKYLVEMEIGLETKRLWVAIEFVE